MEAGALLSVVWLANKLAQYGRGIEAGSLIMSGSFTKQYGIAKGDAVRSEFTPFGTVEARFETPPATATGVPGPALHCRRAPLWRRRRSPVLARLP